MNNEYETIICSFGFSPDCKIKEYETLSTYIYKADGEVNPSFLDGAKIQAIIEHASCSFTITISCDEWSEVICANAEIIKDCFNAWKQSYDEMSSDKRISHIEICGTKSQEHSMVIVYRPSAFYHDEKLNVFAFLRDLNSIIEQKKNIELLKCGVVAIKLRNPEWNKITNFQVHNSHFLQSGDYYHLHPLIFAQIVPDSLANLWSLSRNLLAMLFLFDLSDIGLNSGQVKFVLKGKKYIETSINIEKCLNVDSFNTYFDIYSWIFSQGGHWSDKLSLARNIMSLHINPDNLSVNRNCLSSILSGFDIYLKENVATYLDLKKRLAEYLSEMTSTIVSALSDMSSNMKVNLGGMLTFVFAEVISSISTSGNLSLFQDSRIIIVELLAILFAFSHMLLSSRETRHRISLYVKGFDNLKSQYTNLLDENDLNECLNSATVEEAERNANLKRTSYFYIWFFSLLALLVSFYILYIEKYTGFLKCYF